MINRNRTDNSQKTITSGTDAFLSFLRDRINSINLIVKELELRYDEVSLDNDQRLKTLATYISKNMNEIKNLSKELEKIEELIKVSDERVINIEEFIKNLEVEKTVWKRIITFFQYIPGWIVTAITIGGVVITYIINHNLLP